MRRLWVVPVLLAVCLAGCSANRDFEKDILGHQAGDPNGPWAQQPAKLPPPPPSAPMMEPQFPPAPASAMREPAPAPVAPQPAPTPAPMVQHPAPVMAAARPATPMAPRSQAMPAPAVAPAVGQRQSHYAFQVGAFAHAQNAKQLQRKLESRGFSVRVEEGHTAKRAFYTVFASKAGSRASLEHELFTCGVTEPVLTGMQPAQRHRRAPDPMPTAEPTPAKTFSSSSQTRAARTRTRQQRVAPSPQTVAPARQSVAPVRQPVARTQQNVAPAKPAVPTAAPAGRSQQQGQVRYAPPKVEPAPPLPDGYVPPPKAASGS